MVNALFSFLGAPASRRRAGGTPALPRLCLAALLFTSTLGAKDLIDYQVGDVAEQDLVTPVALTVVDAEATDALKQKAAAQTPVVVCQYSSAADEVEARFRESFTKTRGSFLYAVNQAFNHRQLNAQELASTQFQEVVDAFQKKNKNFPLDPIRAALWAGGDPDKAYEAALAGTLRKAMSAPIRPEPVPSEFKMNAPLQLVTLAQPTAMLTPQIIEQEGKEVTAAAFVSLADLRAGLQQRFIAEEWPVGRYLAGLLQPNCAVDGEATRQWRARRSETLVATMQYAAGEVLARRGQPIDRKVKAALDQIRDKAVVSQWQQRPPADAQPAPAAAAANLNQVHWLIGLLVAAVLILALAVWQLARRRQPVSLLPVPLSAGALEASDESWRQRALVAEQRAEKAQAMVRAGVLAHLAHWFSEKFVQRLISQRRHLLEHQQLAIAEITELAARLEKVHAPLQERLQAYERRIAELEKELALKGQLNRELIKAKIEMVRKQLETEREKNPDRVALN